MPDVLEVLFRKWKKMLIFTMLATGLALLITLFLPDEYSSTTTSLPASSISTDKARIFNDHIEALYPDIGTPDELDRIIGTSALDTLYISVAKKLNLAQHYKVKEINDAVYSAAMRLRKNSRIYKSAYGELKVEVWDKNRKAAALFANTLTDELEGMHQELQNKSNVLILTKLKEDYAMQQQAFIQTSDSLNKINGALHEILANQKKAQAGQLEGLQKLIAQYNLVVNTRPLVLLKVEGARPAIKPSRPDRIKIAVVTFIAAFIFSFLMLLFIESRKWYAATGS